MMQTVEYFIGRSYGRVQPLLLLIAAFSIVQLWEVGFFQELLSLQQQNRFITCRKGSSVLYKAGPRQNGFFKFNAGEQTEYNRGCNDKSVI